MGTSDFAVPILEALNKAPFFDIAAVYCQIDRPNGRGMACTCCVVKDKAEGLGLQIQQPLNFKNKEEIQKLKMLKPDLIIVTAYGMILPKEVLEIPRFGCINVHPSLLPLYRGPAPIQQAIIDNIKETGVSIMLLDEKMDHGAILAQERMQIEPNNNYLILSQKLSGRGAELLIKTILTYIEGKIKAEPQDDQKATFTKMIKKEDGKINWQEDSQTINQRIKAYFEWPTSFTFWNQKRIIILEAENIDIEQKDKKVGEVFIVEDEMNVRCGKGILKIKKLQLEGKKEITGKEFLRGYLAILGVVLE